VAVVSMKDLLEAGVHFGHRTQRWHPKMKPYLFTERNGIHIIDLQQTMSQLQLAHQRVQNVVASGGTVLFVGTKKQAQQTIAESASTVSMPYVDYRWLGGTLTNFRTIRQRVEYLQSLEQQQARGEFERLTKKEALDQQRTIEKLDRRLGGLREMRRLPDLVFITDVKREDIAVNECNRLDIPIIAMVDTNCDPDPVDLVIPANDDAIRAIKLITGVIADGVSEGLHMREVIAAEEGEDYLTTDEEIREPEIFLGPSTLAKLRSGMLDDGDEHRAEPATDGEEEEEEVAIELEAAEIEVQEAEADEVKASAVVEVEAIQEAETASPGEESEEADSDERDAS
jgi:small subunit ribosomal protein S2